MSKLAISVALILPLSLAASEPGIKRFEQVNEHVYRGAQPDNGGFAALAKLGVKTVIDLRDSAQQSQREQREVEQLGMHFVSAPMNMKAPTDQQISGLLSQLASNSAWPVFVHCQGGRDRTGTVIACYRMVHDGWTNSQAFQEAKLRGLRALRGLERYIQGYQASH